MYDYAKLLGRIKEKCGTQSEFAKQMGVSERTICQKLNNKVDFSQTEVLKASSILGISRPEIEVYFFTVLIQKLEQK